MNALIGKDGNDKISLRYLSTRNGEYLAYFSPEKSLAILTTKFQKRHGKLLTYTYINSIKAKIDDILMNKERINSALNCEAYSFFLRSIFRSQNRPCKDAPVVKWLKQVMQNLSKRDRIPVALLRLLLDKYSWERHEPLYPPSYGLNNTTTVL